MRINEPERARVVSVGKNAAWIVFDSESIPRVATLKRTTGKREMLVPGDLVSARRLEDETALVDAVAERHSVLQRRSGERTKTMAANIDTIAAVTALADPPPRLVLLDQLLAFAEFESLEALVLFTKPDLASPAIPKVLDALYRSLGYATLTVNPKTGSNLEALKEVLRTKHAMLAGVSGVGKSSLFRALGGESVVGAVSRHGIGKQTTTASRLYRTGEGFLIDSPGVGEFGLGEVTPQELAQAFREMREPASRCRFNDCSHLREPGCMVQAAVDGGTIVQSRYESYRYILLGSC
ncbi:MAG: ribosome small subunit-dependent GTPase A [Candidatus Eremiobacteraeota bacterium]|nr:ribosome small subunit-dependent GTPase A [Candidatus Eremiobacteraeota bacterium]